MTTLDALIGSTSGQAPASQNWLWQALTSPLSRLCLAILLVGTVLLILGVRALVRLRRRQPPAQRSLAGDQSGSAMMEFVLVFPIVLFLILLLTQTTLVMAGNLYVHYAAFTAARSAVVVIPADYSAQDGEPSNTITPAPNFAKYDRIRLAAVWALVPVSGKLAAGTPQADAFANGLSQYFTAYNRPIPYWVSNVLPDRVRYADANTTIRFMTTTVQNDPPGVTFTPVGEGVTTEFGYKDPITVEVTHHLNLSIPGVRSIFSDGRAGNISYKTISAQYTLTNEGMDTQLPPKPPIDRFP
jgi:Flp pilus assembly protein TadG